MIIVNCNVCKKRTVQSIVVLTVLWVFVISGCATVPKLTAEDRKTDIQFMADWARDYSPFVELAEKHKGTPSYKALLPNYLEYAEQAESNEEFCQVVKEYYKLICPAGHVGLIDEDTLKVARIANLLGIIDVGIDTSSIGKAIYWPKLVSGRLYARAHPPFSISYKDDKYLIDEDWEVAGATVPRGSQIVKVNGMSCSAYLDFIKENAPLKYDAYPKDWIEKYLLIIDEGEDFKGWQVDFFLPDKSTHSAFVPKIQGSPASKRDFNPVESKDNCTCIELTDQVAYIRIKSMSAGTLSAIFPSIIKKDGKIIKNFLDNANGKYRKLIIDVRRNGGGKPYYFFENLIRPFLNESVTYEQVAGIRRKYRDNLKKSVLKTYRKNVSEKREHVVSTEEIDSPEGFDPKVWAFYRLWRKIEPCKRYNFDGSIYILIDRRTFSAADDYANAVKRIGFAKLVGQNTSGGSAAYISPSVIRLPASSMIFKVETELVINPDGSINELFGTPPDIQLEPAESPKSITKQELLKDEWIKWILADSQD